MTETKELKVDDIRKAADEKKCEVRRALYYVTEFLAGPMCGRCFPCSMGSYEARIRLEKIANGRGAESDLDALKRISSEMLDASMCKKGKDTARFVQEWLGSGIFREHIEGRCPERECSALIEYVIVPEKCTMCGLCQEACGEGAILGKKKKPYLSGYLPFEIRQKRCNRCGECIKVCPEGAIIIQDVGKGEPVPA